LVEDVFPMEFQDNANARELRANGGYLPAPRLDGEPAFSAQNYFMAAAVERTRAAST
jgi:hypothetical protein